MTTRRVTLRVGGAAHDLWTSVEITRDLAEISGGFLIELHDIARLRRALPGPRPAAMPPAVDIGAACQLLLDNELVLDGYVDDVKLVWSPDRINMSVAGRDRTGDLVDCAATRDGPVEYRGLRVDEIAARICEPFGIGVRADVDTGPPLDVFSLDVAETALEAVEKAARQRGLLALSDGVGGLVLTRAGTRRGPAPLALPGNVEAAVITRSARQRFRDYVVKGQTKPARAGGPALDGSANPLSPTAPPAARPVQQTERASVVLTGTATDAAIARYRPWVALSRTQSGGVSVQTQADWTMRVARGKSEQLTYTLRDWRAGPDRRLWRANELVAVDDALAGVAGDMLISAVIYRYSGAGAETELTLTGPEAFDLLPDEDRREARRRRDAARPLDGAARPLEGDR